VDHAAITESSEKEEAAQASDGLFRVREEAQHEQDENGGSEASQQGRNGAGLPHES
jgi:hypothetical protein